MKQELAWGTAAAVAIVAAVGISSQPGGKSDATSPAGKKAGQAIVTTIAAKEGESGRDFQPQCADTIPLLEHFFLHEKITGPPSCYQRQPVPTPLDSRYQTEFIIATLPDPLHTHSSLLFDRLVEGIQESAQDENYEYDSSWLPWETEESSLALLKDQDDAEERKEMREEQPGIVTFRGTSDESGDSPYRRALIVFVVGEESTSGIHRRQFENAVAWIKALQRPDEKGISVAILGPTFSGSFSSLAELLEKTEGMSKLNGGGGFSIYSGSASSQKDGVIFARTNGVRFRSFVQDDTTALNYLCQYFKPTLTNNLAVLSEDETAYGSIVARKSFASGPVSLSDTCADAIAVNVFYPRDISSLRAAYQSQSMFTSGSGETNSDNGARKTLPTDLADPEGQQHDTVRRYAGNQIPLSQEAQLMGIVDVLRAHHAEYVIIRSSSTLDPLFLANFLRRDYPDARVVIDNSDLLYERGQDAMGLNGVMTLSTYPLFSRARDWTALPFPGPHSHRVFPENSTEGTYIASRLLLQTLARAHHRTPQLNCEFDEDTPHQAQQIFAPALRCEPKAPIFAPLPDYAPPFWTDPDACELTSQDRSCKPAMWLSVVTRNGTSPLATLNEQTLYPGATGTSGPPAGSTEHGSWPETPRSIKLLLVVLCGLAVFHFLCCWFASFTAKPAFRAHFASVDGRNTWLVLIGSYLITLMALFTGWGCGTFSTVPSPPAITWQMVLVIVFVCAVSAGAIVVNIVTVRRLNGTAGIDPDPKTRMIIALGLFSISVLAFFIFWVRPIEGGMRLANRAFVYWRCMHLITGVSPLVPFLSLAAGLYFWFWYALHGLALFGPDRPRLPRLEKLIVKFPPEAIEPGQPTELKLTMFSHEHVAEPAEKMAKPLAWANVIVTAVVFVVLGALLIGVRHGVPIRSLGGGRTYAMIFFVALIFYCSFILSEGWKITQTWRSVRQLLVFLDRMALRRTLSALHGFSWGNVWKMSGNVLDVRYKLLSRQLECLNHLYSSLSSPAGQWAGLAGIGLCKDSVRESLNGSRHFADWYSRNYDEPNATGLEKFEALQEQIAKTTGVVLTELLVPAIRTEKQSLIQVDPDDDCDEDRMSPPRSKDELIRNAEELICLTYLGFSQNLLGRIRTIVLGGIYLFIALSIAVSSYPFDPRTFVSAILLSLFVVFGGIVLSTYADMHRDVTLSHLTNTKPGELGSEFWFKVIGYGAAPLLGLITQVFPQWSGFLFSWLQPGLSSLK